MVLAFLYDCNQGLRLYSRFEKVYNHSNFTINNLFSPQNIEGKQVSRPFLQKQTDFSPVLLGSNESRRDYNSLFRRA